MAPHSRIVLIRHGQAAHNVADDFNLHDPILTERGEAECHALIRDAFMTEYKHAKDVDCLLVSPLKRTLQTALGSFGKTLMVHPKVETILLAALQETSTRPCDVGHPISDLESLFPQYDFSTVDPKFTDKSEGTFYHPDNLAQRTSYVRKYLYESKHSVIVAVTHAGLLKRLTPQYFQITSGPRKDAYRNCEYREFTFAEHPDANQDVETNHVENVTKSANIGEPYKLIETKWSKENREVKRAMALLTTDVMELDTKARDEVIEQMDVRAVGIGAKSEISEDSGLVIATVGGESAAP